MIDPQSPRKYDFLKAEARSPYRGLRQFFYLAFAGSGAIGGFIAGLRLLAHRGEPLTNWQNLALQVGVVILFMWLWTKDRPRKN
ncbi:MAG: DUF3493 domain-containing protein [Pseudanabaenaceae cyanobacterium]